MCPSQLSPHCGDNLFIRERFGKKEQSSLFHITLMTPASDPQLPTYFQRRKGIGPNPKSPVGSRFGAKRRTPGATEPLKGDSTENSGLFISGPTPVTRGTPPCLASGKARCFVSVLAPNWGLRANSNAVQISQSYRRRPVSSN